jgi:GntR family transcriptional regulator
VPDGDREGVGASSRKTLKYRRIAEDLRGGIRRGEYEPGRPLPAENDLMARYQVARMTVRQALAELEREGLAVARRGSGVYVSDLRPIVRDELGWLATMPWLRGEAGWDARADSDAVEVTDLALRVEAAAEGVEAALAVPVGSPVRVATRRLVSGGRALLISTSWLPLPDFEDAN